MEPCNGVRSARVPTISIALVGLFAGCGSQAAEVPADTARAINPPPAEIERAPKPLAQVARQADELLPGGAAAFEARLEELRGYPVVVNKWASWCGPCRAEFPFFGSQANGRFGEVAFLGVNSEDNETDAAEFLTRFPVGYPSYLDPDSKVAQVFNGVTAFPTTAFYDADGELVYVKQGGYATEELLAQDIDRYAVSSEGQ